ncbi:MAG: PfkB family carbohydrate kinase [Halodesulfurarchaeum sp.]|nr:PfkB family carbohydrate kinase [Halodesulfurarchaeum sp.]
MGQIFAAGHCNWDVTLLVASLPAPDGEARITGLHRSGGGSAANVASALAGYDLDAGLIGSVGDDDQGRMVKRELEETGVDVAGVLTVPGGETTVKYLVVDADGEVMVLANEGVNEAIGPDDLDPDHLAGADHVHLTGQRPETADRLIDLAREGDLTVSFDPGRRIEERAFEPLLDRVDVLLLNELEAEAVFDGSRGERIERAAGEDRVIVVKRGSDGASAYTAAGTVHHPGFAVEAVDTTGAGDAFAAGFLAATVGGRDFGPETGSGAGTGTDHVLVGDQVDVERVLAVTNASGALTVTEPGARTTPTAAELAAFLAERTGE